MTAKIAILTMVVAVTCCFLRPVEAQVSGSNSNAVWNNLGGGALAERAPGNMVSAGIARANAFQGRAFSRPNITAREDEPDLGTALRIQAIQALFDNLNAVLLAFNNVLRAEGGLSPYIPTPIRPGGVTGGLDLGSIGGS